MPLNTFMFRAPFSITDATLALKATRDVYGKIPELSGVFENKYNQILLSLMPLEPYDLLTSFAIMNPEDLAGHTVSGAGPNFPWLKVLGAKVYATRGQHDHTSATSPYDASIAFASLATSLKLYDKGMTHFVRTGLGAQVILVLTVNRTSLTRFPDDVQAILKETAADFERTVAERTRDRYAPHIEELGDAGMVVKQLTPSQQRSWAAKIAPWTKEEAKKLADMPGGKGIIELFMKASEAQGHVWPSGTT